MLGMWRIAYQDKLDNGKRVETFLHGLPINEWDAEVNMRLFACVGSVNFFKHIINSVVFQNGLMALGRCEYYMAMPPPIYIVRKVSKIVFFLKNILIFLHVASNMRQQGGIPALPGNHYAVSNYVHS